MYKVIPVNYYVDQRAIISPDGETVAIVVGIDSANRLANKLNGYPLDISNLEQALHHARINKIKLKLIQINSSHYDIIKKVFSDKSLQKYDDWNVNTIDIDDEFKVMNTKHDWNTPHSTNNYIVEVNGNQVGFVCALVSPYSQAELGYYILKKYSNNGFASSALASLISIAKKNNIHRVTCTIDPLHTASIKIAQYNGMIQCAHLHHSAKIRGKWVNEIVMEKILR